MTAEQQLAYDSRMKEIREEVEAHGFYWSALSEEERIMYDIAKTRTGLDDEIQLLKIKIRSVGMLMSMHAIGLMTRMIACLDRLMKTNKIVFKRGEVDTLTQAVRRVFLDMPVPPAMVEQVLRDTAPAS